MGKKSKENMAVSNSMANMSWDYLCCQPQLKVSRIMTAHKFYLLTPSSCDY